MSRVRWDRDVAAGAGNAAVAYERYLVPGVFRPSAEALLDVAPPNPEDRVLDVGCGTGIVALLAAERVGPAGALSAVDVNPGMLEVARSLPGSERVEWRHADAVDLPYADASFDLVYSQHTLQFIPDRLAALREMHRVLAPGGRLAVATWGPVERSPGYLVLGAALARHVGPEAGAAITKGPFSLSDADELASLLEEAAFVQVELRSVDVSTGFPSAAEFLAGVLPWRLRSFPPRRR